jgi:hypothetical protein
MTDSILISVKKFLGLPEDYSAFDLDVIYYINSVFAVLYQLGVGDKFSITGIDEEWADYLFDEESLNMVQADVFQRVKMLFDPPQTAHAISANNRITDELDWRLYIAAEELEYDEEI